MEDLFEKIKKYSQSDIYPFHMPGHKRRPLTEERSYSIDITEIDGFDNLHQPEGFFRAAQEAAADLYETLETKFLINGSTCGLLAAISACCFYGGKILVARNCHKAVYNGILLRGLRPVYVYPRIEPRYGLNGSISPEDVKMALEDNKDVQAVLITSPTYDGILSDIKAISQVAHDYGIPLIVDEAHGAHLPFCYSLFPESALKNGADIVIHSLHKTLPAFTQTALLHINSHRVDREEIAKYLAVYQSSSPSYILLAGICRCLQWLKEESYKDFVAYEERLLLWRRRYCELLADTEAVRLANFEKKDDEARTGIYAYDMSKLIFSTKGSCLSGEELYQIFREKHHLQMEMAACNYVLALSSVWDKEEGFQRLYEALEEEFAKNSGNRTAWQILEKEKAFIKEKVFILPKAKQILTLSEAEKKKKQIMDLEKSAGFVSASSLYLYPPGIPFLLPGEEITEELIGYARNMQAAGQVVRGLEGENGIFVLKT